MKCRKHKHPCRTLQSLTIFNFPSCCWQIALLLTYKQLGSGEHITKKTPKAEYCYEFYVLHMCVQNLNFWGKEQEQYFHLILAVIS